jgi:adenosylmethionine-8-amino-7-oxononanoate aminotransferase
MPKVWKPVAPVAPVAERRHGLKISDSGYCGRGRSMGGHDEMYRPETVYHGTIAPNDFRSFNLSRGGRDRMERFAEMLDQHSPAAAAAIAGPLSQGAGGEAR